MSSGIINCKKCNKIFKKVLTNLCADCIAKEEEHFRLMYRILQQSSAKGGVALEDLAHQVDLPVEEVESMYLSGRFGTAGIYLKFQCQGCSVMMTDMTRRGRFCITCSEKTAQKAGVEVRSKQDIEKRDQQDQMKQQHLNALNKGNEAKHGPDQFGFKTKAR